MEIGIYVIGAGYILLIYAYVQYIRGISLGNNPPANPASWWVFSAISFGNAIVLWENISPIMRVFPLVMGTAQAAIARVSYKKIPQVGLEREDKISLLVGLFGVLLWVTSSLGVIPTENWVPMVALIIADMVGFSPTIRDAWRKPSREDIPVWGIFSFTGGLVLGGLYLSGEGGFNFLYPAYETALAISTMLVLVFRSR